MYVDTRGPKAAALDSPIQDLRVRRVIARLHAERRYPADGPRSHPDYGPEHFADYGFSIFPEQGNLIYLLCRAMRARRVVEFASSIGFSTLFFAAALRDNGGGLVIGSELVPNKVAAARRNLSDAGLDDYAEIRAGDARQTLRNLGGPVDFVLIDGWPITDGPSLALQVMQVVAPQLRVGAYVMNDNAEPDFLDYIRDPTNGFLSISLPLKGGTELAVKVG